MGTQSDFGNFRSGYEALSELWKVQTLALGVQEATENFGEDASRNSQTLSISRKVHRWGNNATVGNEEGPWRYFRKTGNK